MVYIPPVYQYRGEWYYKCCGEPVGGFATREQAEHAQAEHVDATHGKKNR